MNAVNYQAEMEKVIKSFGGQKRTLLLHACCAPCSSACLERLKDFFDITVLFYNPNIEEGEYLKRKAELMRFITETGWAKNLECEHDERAFYSAVKGLEGCEEGGERCAKCFYLRLGYTAAKAAEGGYDYFATTLTLSPLKNAALINKTGLQVGKEHGANYLVSDFKKKDGYLRSLQLSAEYNLYRQNFCGCVFSRGGTPAK